MSRHDALQQWLEQRWYGPIPPNRLLRLFAGLFGLLARGRRAAYQRGWLRSTRLPVPIVVVGNISIGGVGKTPLTLALVDALRARGWRPGVISRGYGGSARDATRVGPQSSPAEVGDEPCLIQWRSGAPVAVAPRRVAAAELLLASGEVDVLIADDGLQHYALQRDVEIVVIDGQRRFGNGRLLPAGPLREPIQRAARAAFRVVNGAAAGADEWEMRLELQAAVPLQGGKAIALNELRGPVHAVAGIGHPARFFQALGRHGLDYIEHPFPDHHAFLPGDFAFDDGRPLLMTEKDAIKCRAFARPHWYAVPAQAILPAAFFDEINRDICAARGLV